MEMQSKRIYSPAWNRCILFPMYRALMIGILLLAVCGLSVAQDPKAECPKILIEGPSGVMRAIEGFTVRIDPYDEEPGRQFNWTVTGGKLLSADGGKKIEVEIPESGTLIVKVEVRGLPLGCPNTVSESASIDPAPKAVMIDHFDRRLIASDSNLLQRVIRE